MPCSRDDIRWERRCSSGPSGWKFAQEEQSRIQVSVFLFMFVVFWKEMCLCPSLKIYERTDRKSIGYAPATFDQIDILVAQVMSEASRERKSFTDRDPRAFIKDRKCFGFFGCLFILFIYFSKHFSFFFQCYGS